MLLFVCIGCERPSEQWDTLVIALPQVVRVKDAALSTTNYILFQTHKTYLKINSEGSYDSDILESWSSSLDSKEFVFCLKDNLKFSERHKFDPVKMKKHFARLFPKATLKVNSKSCITLMFLVPAQGLLDQLVHLSSAPSLKIDDTSDEFGLGPYYVFSRGESEIFLRLKKGFSARYTSIRMQKYTGKEKFENYEDINQLPSNLTVKFDNKHYKNFPNVRLQTGVLLINHETLDVRNRIWNCIDKNMFADLYNEGAESRTVGTIVPVGVKGGSDVPILPRKCKKGPSISLPYLDWKGMKDASFKKIQRQVEKTSGVYLYKKVVEMREFVDMFAKHRLPEGIIFVGFDTAAFHYNDFYEVFFKKPLALSWVTTDEIRQKFDRLTSTAYEKVRPENVLELELFIQQKSYALPVFQKVVTLKYPRNILINSDAQGLMQYPFIQGIK